MKCVICHKKGVCPDKEHCDLTRHLRYVNGQPVLSKEFLKRNGEDYLERLRYETKTKSKKGKGKNTVGA